MAMAIHPQFVLICPKDISPDIAWFVLRQFCKPKLWCDVFLISLSITCCGFGLNLLGHPLLGRLNASNQQTAKIPAFKEVLMLDQLINLVVT